MNYERIILELLERIQILEEKVEFLEKANDAISTGGKESNKEKSRTTDDVNNKNVGLTKKARNYIMNCKEEARSRGQKEVTLLCNDIQKALGVINRTPSICKAMKDCMTNPNDTILKAPPSGKSTTVLIKYYLDVDTKQSWNRLLQKQCQSEYSIYISKNTH